MHKSHLIVLTLTLLVVVAQGGYVCNQIFKAGLTSFFIRQDSKVSYAEDEAELCHLCTKVVRLAYLYTNEQSTRGRWSAVLRDNACVFTDRARQKDCSSLTEGVIRSETDYFSSNTSHFSRDELKLTTKDLSLILDRKSLGRCKAIKCCPKTDKKGKFVKPACKLPVGTMRKHLQQLKEERDILNREQRVNDEKRDRLDSKRRKINKHEADLEIREANIKDKIVEVKKHEDDLRLYKRHLDATHLQLQATNATLLLKEKVLNATHHKLVLKEKALVKREKEVTLRENLIEMVKDAHDAAQPMMAPV